MKDKPTPMKVNTIPSASYHNCFWDMCGMMFIDYLIKGETINDKLCTSLLQYLSEEIKKNVYILGKGKCCFKKYIEQVDTSVVVMAEFKELKFRLLHIPYWPNLVPSKFLSFL